MVAGEPKAVISRWRQEAGDSKRRVLDADAVVLEARIDRIAGAVEVLINELASRGTAVIGAVGGAVVALLARIQHAVTASAKCEIGSSAPAREHKCEQEHNPVS